MVLCGDALVQGGWIRKVAAKAAGGYSYSIELALELGSFKTRFRGANGRRSDPALASG